MEAMQTIRGGGMSDLMTWQPPETAPKTGTFLADVGWPWPVVAMWSEAADSWIYADVQHSLFEGAADPIFVNETEDKLRAWMPLPEVRR